MGLASKLLLVAALLLVFVGTAVWLTVDPGGPDVVPLEKDDVAGAPVAAEPLENTVPASPESAGMAERRETETGGDGRAFGLKKISQENVYTFDDFEFGGAAREYSR